MTEGMILNYLTSLNGEGVSPAEIEKIGVNKKETRENVQKLLIKGKIAINDDLQLVLR